MTSISPELLQHLQNRILKTAIVLLSSIKHYPSPSKHQACQITPVRYRLSMDCHSALHQRICSHKMPQYLLQSFDIPIMTCRRVPKRARAGEQAPAADKGVCGWPAGCMHAARPSESQGSFQSEMLKIALLFITHAVWQIVIDCVSAL